MNVYDYRETKERPLFRQGILEVIPYEVMGIIFQYTGDIDLYKYLKKIFKNFKYFYWKINNAKDINDPHLIKLLIDKFIKYPRIIRIFNDKFYALTFSIRKDKNKIFRDKMGKKFKNFVIKYNWFIKFDIKFNSLWSDHTFTSKNKKIIYSIYKNYENVDNYCGPYIPYILMCKIDGIDY